MENFYADDHKFRKCFSVITGQVFFRILVEVHVANFGKSDCRYRTCGFPLDEIIKDWERGRFSPANVCLDHNCDRFHCGIIFGWLYWKLGIECAILAHFAIDAVASGIVVPAYSSGNLFVQVIAIVVFILTALIAGCLLKRSNRVRSITP